MLVLTRKVGEQLVIDGDVVVTILSVQGNKVRVGVEAPQDVTVDRREIHDRREAAKIHERREAATREAAG